MRKTLKYYYAELLDVSSDNRFKTYGYVFKDNNIQEARLHAVETARTMSIVPLATVWRISREDYDRLVIRFELPTQHSSFFEEEERETA